VGTIHPVTGYGGPFTEPFDAIIATIVMPLPACFEALRELA
jgi:hypothetical protein